MGPDVGVTAMAFLACYLFWRWLKVPTWGRTIGCGVAFGLALLAKSNTMALFPIWPVVWIIWAYFTRRENEHRHRVRQMGQFVIIFLLGVYVLNLGYGFEGSLQRLDKYKFVSQTLSGGRVSEKGFGNRFDNTWLGRLPVPLPQNFLVGMDIQKSDFENSEGRRRSFFRGQWYNHGWWWYYFYVLAVKVPFGTWGLLVVATLTCFRRGLSQAKARDSFALLTPAAAMFILASSQSGFSHHLRYVLPVFPFAFIWASRAFLPEFLRNWKPIALSAALFVWTLGSSLWIYPHSLAYFNELAGGPMNGHYHLLDSNIDWGEDLIYLKEWIDEHPEAQPIRVAYWGIMRPEYAGIETELPPPGSLKETMPPSSDPDNFGPHPGWHVISVSCLRGDARYGPTGYDYFLHFKPVDTIGYTIYIYNLSLKEVNRVRKELELNPTTLQTQY